MAGLSPRVQNFVCQCVCVYIADKTESCPCLINFPSSQIFIDSFNKYVKILIFKFSV